MPIALVLAAALAQSAAGAPFDFAATPGANFDEAEFPRSGNWGIG